VLLWLHVPAVFVFALTQRRPVLHSSEEAMGVAAFAIAAMWYRYHRTAAMVLTSLGLLTASAALVHLSNGVIEMHFHYFVMVGVITLYQDWKPFLMAIGYVVLQHGVMGAIAPASVYNHPEAVSSPWKWAAIHGAFILGMSAAGIVTWRLNEGLLQGLSEREQRLTEAQELARVGSWERDLRTGEVTWSDQHYALLGLEPGCPNPRQRFLAMVHADDRRGFEDAIDGALSDGAPFALDLRVELPGGDLRWLHARGDVSERADGLPVVLTGTTQDVTERHRSEDALKETLSLLNATLDSTADGILVVDGDGRITSFNQQFAEMWRIPSDVLDARDDDRAIAVVLGQLVDPDGFIAKVKELYLQPDAESHDVLMFKDGRVFDRYSKPQRVGGTPVGRVWSFRDVTDRKRLEEELAHQAFHDSLTGLANQLLFRDRVDHALSRVARRGEVLAVLFVDLDNFKTVNDSLGHPAGDSLLLAVAERLRDCLRAADTAARLGGDEFAILLEDGTGHSDAQDVAARILEALREPFSIAGKELFITASIGMAFTEVGTETTDLLLRNADLAMYRAKVLGRNRQEVFEPSMHSAVVERMDLEADLRRAVERREFVLQYQPIVDVATERVTGVEALVRWQHPERGRLYPDAFIAVAEETGLINEIGLQVLQEASIQAETWRRRYPAHQSLVLNVNLSPGQLAEPRLVQWVSDAIDAAGCDPATLVLEITESATVRREAGEKLIELKSLGLLLAVDDFGTGYSSLSYLQRLPIDVLKIDRSFISGAAPDGATLPRAIVELAKALRLKTIAEGVETAEQAARLFEWGCQQAQGFYYHRPQDGDAIEALLAGALVG
jgi:diguanylate cyclase (GGDEF)-like protein